MIAIVFSSIFAGLIAIAAFVIIYYAIETRRQGFKIFRQKLEYFSSIVAIDEEEVSFRARGKDMTSGLLDNIGLVGRAASLVLAGPHTTEKGIITRRIISQNGSLEEGAWVRTSLFVHEENPKANLNLDYHDVSFESELGYTSFDYDQVDVTVGGTASAGGTTFTGAASRSYDVDGSISAFSMIFGPVIDFDIMENLEFLLVPGILFLNCLENFP